jgi:hypothetical protein
MSKINALKTANSGNTAKDKLAAFLAENPDVNASFNSISSDIAKDKLEPSIQSIWDAWFKQPGGIQSCLDIIEQAGEAGKGFMPPWRSPRLDYEINKHKMLTADEIVAKIIEDYPNHAKLPGGTVNDKAIKKFLADYYTHDKENGYEFKPPTKPAKTDNNKNNNAKE